VAVINAVFTNFSFFRNRCKLIALIFVDLIGFSHATSMDFSMAGESIHGELRLIVGFPVISEVFRRRSDPTTRTLKRGRAQHLTEKSNETARERRFATR
jgi:hypothetical protein